MLCYNIAVVAWKRDVRGTTVGKPYGPASSGMVLFTVEMGPLVSRRVNRLARLWAANNHHPSRSWDLRPRQRQIVTVLENILDVHHADPLDRPAPPRDNRRGKGGAGPWPVKCSPFSDQVRQDSSGAVDAGAESGCMIATSWHYRFDDNRPPTRPWSADDRKTRVRVNGALFGASPSHGATGMAPAWPSPLRMRLRPGPGWI